MWTCGPDPIDSHQPWPVPIVEALTTSFSAPRARVLLGPDADEAAMEAVRALDREVGALAGLEPNSTDGQSRPFWADLVTGGATHTAAAPNASNPTAVAPGERVELILVSLPADAAAVVSLDRLALMAAARLRFGGVLAVYTHSDWNQGYLSDPTGAVIAAAQNADLLYLQHIVTLHTPVRDGQLRAAPTPAAAEYEVARHRATARGLPAPHLRAHGDVLVFAQPSEPAGDRA